MGKLKLKNHGLNKRDKKSMLKNAMYSYSELVKFCVMGGLEVTPENTEEIFKYASQDSIEFIQKLKQYCYDPIANHDVLFGNPDEYATTFEEIAMMFTKIIMPQTYHNEEMLKMNHDEFVEFFIKTVDFKKMHTIYNSNVGTILAMQQRSHFDQDVIKE